MLQNLIQSNSLEVWQGFSISEQSINFINGPNTNSTGLAVVKDLILTTSFICSNCQAPSSSSDFVRRNTVSPLSTLIALSPYWAIATLLVQVRAAEADYNQLRDALSFVLTSKITSRAHVDISEEILSCSNHLPAALSKNILANQVLTRIKKALRTQLKNILLFAVTLSVSFHSELSCTLHNPALALSQGVINQLLSHYDDNCIDIVHLIASASPQLALVSDTGSVGATPLAYAASSRYQNTSDADVLEFKLSLGLCKVLTEVAPSALALTDRLGMLPLHHAAKKGHSLVMEYLSQHFHFTIPLKDSSGKTPLHHALSCSKQHNEESIVKLAKLCPRILRDGQVTQGKTNTRTMEPLEYAQRHCSESLYNALLQIYQQEKEKILSQVKNLFLLEKLHERHSERRNQFRAGPPMSPTLTMTTNNSSSENEEEEEYDEEVCHSDSNDSTDHSFYSGVSNSSGSPKMEEKECEELRQYADTLLLLQSSKCSLTRDDVIEDCGRNKRQKLAHI
jgi:hypothetical protein